MVESQIEHEHTVIEKVDPVVGTIIDREFRIDSRLAAGGFGVIYRAMHLPTRRAVALKVLHPHMTADPSIVARFRREGATLAQLRDPHTVVGTDVVRAPDGTLYIAMELLQGTSLFRLMKKGSLPWRRAVAIARGIASSLREAHGLGIVHRDLKPENIHLESRGGVELVKVLDFGIAKLIDTAEPENKREELTQAGTWIGTLDYMSPEQMMTNECDGRSDLFSLGVLLYEMIAGRRPNHDAKSAAQILAAIFQDKSPPLSRLAPEVPRALEEICAKLFRRAPDDRIQTADELITLFDILDSDDDHATRVHEIQPDTGSGGVRRRFARGSERSLPNGTPLVEPSEQPTRFAKPTPAMMADTVLPEPREASAATPAPVAPAYQPATPRPARAVSVVPVYAPYEQTMFVEEPSIVTDESLLADTAVPMPPMAAGAYTAYPMPVPMPAYPVHDQHPMYPHPGHDPMYPQAYPQQTYQAYPQPPYDHAPSYPTNLVQHVPQYQMPDVQQDTFARRIVWIALAVIAIGLVVFIKSQL